MFSNVVPILTEGYPCNTLMTKISEGLLGYQGTNYSHNLFSFPTFLKENINGKECFNITTNHMRQEYSSKPNVLTYRLWLNFINHLTLVHQYSCSID